MIGNFQAATNFLVLLAFLTNPISTVLFPAFAKLDPVEEPQILKSVFSSSVKFTAIVVVPATAAIMVLSKPMISTLFGDKWIDAPFFLTLYVAGNLLSGIGSISMDGLLRGLGETRTMMKLSLLTLLTALPLAFLLIPNFGIVGVIVGNLLASLPGVFLGLYWIWKKYEVAADRKSSAKIFTASAIAAAITYLSLSLLEAGEPIRLIGGGVIFLLTYIVAAPSMGAIAQDDVNSLRRILPELGLFSRIARIPLDLIERVARRTRFLRK
jgi:O-antigen/teichoic acid export membrane protein